MSTPVIAISWSICAVAKGTDDEYPGLYVSLSPSPDGFNVDQMVACVEYDSSEEVIKTECYMAEAEQPAYIIGMTMAKI